VVAKGGLIIGVLTEGKPYTEPATRGNLDDWIVFTNTPHSWTLDATAPQPGLTAFFGTGIETTVIIQLSTMKIVNRGVGIVQGLAELQALL
jgi:hypothetical protein